MMLPTVPRVFYFNQETLKDPKAIKTEVSEGLMGDRVEEKSGEKALLSASDSSASC